jgi:hypothetical protein
VDGTDTGRELGKVTRVWEPVMLMTGAIRHHRTQKTRFRRGSGSCEVLPGCHPRSGAAAAEQGEHAETAEKGGGGFGDHFTGEEYGVMAVDSIVGYVEPEIRSSR